MTIAGPKVRPSRAPAGAEAAVLTSPLAGVNGGPIGQLRESSAMINQELYIRNFQRKLPIE